jgi:ParB family transcriptional regulator, chromosome partitioning protein
MPQSNTKSSTKRKGFFAEAPTHEDEEARQREVAALLPMRRVVIQDLPVERIAPNPFQARQQFRDLAELSAAIQAQGFITRLRVRPDPEQSGYFQLAYGERRLRAARLAGLTAVPCEIAEHTDDELLEIGLAENIQRRDLEPLDEARAFRLFIDQRNYSIRRLAERIGKDKSYVEDRLALLRTPEDVQRMIEQRPDALRIAREIAKLPTPEERRPLIEGVMEGTVNTDDVRNIVRAVTAPPAASAPSPEEAVSPDSSNRTISGETATADPSTPGSAVIINGVLDPEAAPWRNEDVATRSLSRRGKGTATPASSLRRDMGTLRVILARWQKALPDLTDREKSVLSDYMQEIQDVSKRLQVELQPVDRDPES